MSKLCQRLTLAVYALASLSSLHVASLCFSPPAIMESVWKDIATPMAPHTKGSFSLPFQRPALG